MGRVGEGEEDVVRVVASLTRMYTFFLYIHVLSFFHTPLWLLLLLLLLPLTRVGYDIPLKPHTYLLTHFHKMEEKQIYWRT